MYARTVFDTLMILDANGIPQPNLAESVTSNIDWHRLDDHHAART